MFFFRSVLLIGFISLFASGVLLFIGSLIGYDEYRGGYAVLSADVSVDDRYLSSLISENSRNDSYFFGGSPVSESSQWVLLDNFNSLEIVPLDKYFLRVHSFDPRYDGYADKVRDVFIKDGKRLVYIPLKSGNWNSTLLDRQFVSLLGDIPFSADYYGIGRPLLLFFIMYTAASACLLVICYMKKKSHHNVFNVIVLIPVFSSLAFFGASGLGCIALLLALFILFKEPLNELITHIRSPFKTIYKEIIIPYRYYVLLLPVFAAAFTIIIIFSQLRILFLFIVFITALAVYGLSLFIIAKTGSKHRRFTPLLIKRHVLPDFNFSLYILPFVVAAFSILFITPYQSGTYTSDNQFTSFIDERDYFSHIEYQTSFSTSRIGISRDLLTGSYPGFFFDTDGLPSMGMSETQKSVDFSGFPPFPLKHLMDFFNDVNSGQKLNTNFNNTDRNNIIERLALLVLLFFILPGFLLKSGKDFKLNTIFSGSRRIIRNFRFMDINRNKTLLYNGNERFQKRVQKEA